MGQLVEEVVACRRCSEIAGDPQGGCLKFKEGCCRPTSVFKAKECINYTPALEVVAVV